VNERIIPSTRRRPAETCGTAPRSAIGAVHSAADPRDIAQLRRFELGEREVHHVH
jgi:hypothetical protein